MEYAPDPIADLVGLNNRVPQWLLHRLGPDHGYCSSIQHALASLNDQGKNFEEIADVIAQLLDEGILSKKA